MKGVRIFTALSLMWGWVFADTRGTATCTTSRTSRLGGRELKWKGRSLRTGAQGYSPVQRRCSLSASIDGRRATAFGSLSGEPRYWW